MIKKKIKVLILVSLILVGLVFYYAFFKPNSPKNEVGTNEFVNRPTTPSSETSSTGAPSSSQSDISKTLNTNSAGSKEWHEDFKQLSQRIGQLTEQPELESKKITQLAQSLTKAQLDEVYAVTTSSYSSGDEKLLAIELLTQSPLTDSINHLKEFAQIDPSAINITSPPLQQEFRVLQLMSIEGLASKQKDKAVAEQALRDISQKNPDKNISDAVQRSLWALRGHAPPPEEQGNEALRKVLTGK